ncbi:hypothetical protein OJF2_41000 [Aquisphaera giovannonii]|uniref:Uncharacterized protein n=1 Tax=Aquisphaera giovannonii TaxID=406548 RepID=A0A5B9W5F9_9BACT|nr:hypothetical protein [Aquisphaera giovannonii]QEH35547.1 hypothetical protein OJF2_41000 [Aquisphaera giovannonii]
MTPSPPEVSPRTRRLLLAGAWAAAFLARAVVSPVLGGSPPSRDSVLICVLFSWLFPAGLIAWFDAGSPDRPGNIPWIILIWLAYLAHGVLAVKSRSRVRFFGLLAILAIVLTFNVIGCERIEIKGRAFG